ncbi:MAG: FtsX-like permease family protein [Calditrichia bacterium]
MKILRKYSLRYLLKHPWQMGLSILGIALGVSVVIAIDLANTSASKAFELSMESVSGKSTHQVVGGSAGVPDSVYRKLKVENGLRKAAPVVEKFVTAGGKRTMHLLGVDLFAERPFRSYLDSLDLSGSGPGINGLMAQPGSAFISAETAEILGVSSGDDLNIAYSGKTTALRILGTLNPTNERSRRALENLIICDIATAQEALDMNGHISHIDLILPNENSGKQIEDVICASLSQGVRLLPTAARSGAQAQMAEAFHLNLTALSLLALVVGMFLIYNTITFSVIQRRSHIGLLRANGVTRREIMRLIMGEAIILGIIGTAMGLLLGLLLGKGMLLLITRTINDLYFVLNVSEMQILPINLLKGAALGIGASLLAAFQPAREATRTPARSAISRSAIERSVRQRIPQMSLAGLLFILIGTVILWLPQGNLWLSYGGLLPLFLGFALLTPLAIIIFSKLLAPVTGKLFGLLGRMASRDIASQLSRTTVAIAALAIAVAATIGVGTMVNSFRSTVVHWLETRLQADVYVSPPSLVSRRNDALLDEALLKKLIELPGVAGVNFYRENQIASGDSTIHLIAAELTQKSRDGYRFKSGNPADIWPAYMNGEAVIISEPYSYRHNLNVGSTIRIPTDKGERSFPVAGVYYDYGSDMGLVSLAFDSYKKHWTDLRPSGISLIAAEGMNADTLISHVRAKIPAGQDVLLRSNSYLRTMSIEIFDRTFSVINVLHLLAIVVAFIGILSALMSLQLERTRELGILRANGVTPSQIRGLVTLQTGMMGLIAGILAIPLGNVLAWVLIYIVNQRSFGWTLQFEFIPSVLAQAMLVAIVAAIIAGIYPAIKMSRSSPALALREE